MADVMADVSDVIVSYILIDQIQSAIIDIRKTIKRPDSKAIFQYITSKYASNTTESDILNFLNKMVEQKIFINKPTIKGDSDFIVNRGNEDLNNDTVTHERHAVGTNIDQTPTLINCNTPNKDCNTQPTGTQTDQDNLQDDIFNLKAEFLALKSFVMDELYGIKLSIDRVRTEQCDQTKYLEENTKNLWEEIATKNIIIEFLSENFNQNTNSSYNNKNKDIVTEIQENKNCEPPKDSSFKRPIDSINKRFNESLNTVNSNSIVSQNRFATLYNDESNTDTNEQSNENDVITTSFKKISEVDNNRHKNNLKQVQHHQYNKNNSPNRRPRVVINQHPEKQTVFARPRTVPGDRSYSDAARIEANKSNNTNMKIFSDSIPRGIRIRDFNRFIKSGNARLYGFPGASSKQLSHYMDVNLDNTTDTVIIHVGINDI